MSEPRRLVCLSPAQPPQFSIERISIPCPRKGEVVVRVEASSVNPIDVKRAAGYGRRLLGLKGAGTFPLVLGNDLAGTVVSTGKGVVGLRNGDRVMGVVPTGKGGTYATHVAVEERWLRLITEECDAASLSVYPYTFTTLWQSFRMAGINKNNAMGLEILVHGASGGLGQLAIQLLVRWGASVTAICSTENTEICRSLGAASVWDRKSQPIANLTRRYDAILNFGSWQDEAVLIGCLKEKALGYATTVHPLLSNFDTSGWLGGLWHSWRDFKHFSALASKNGAKYGWVVFKPENEALNVLGMFLGEGAVKLPVGLAVDLSAANRAFEHIADRKRGRAVLLP